MVLSISNRLSDHTKLYNEIAFFDPNRFKEVKHPPPPRDNQSNLDEAEALP